MDICLYSLLKKNVKFFFKVRLEEVDNGFMIRYFCPTPLWGGGERGVGGAKVSNHKSVINLIQPGCEQKWVKCVLWKKIPPIHPPYQGYSRLNATVTTNNDTIIMKPGWVFIIMRQHKRKTPSQPVETYHKRSRKRRRSCYSTSKSRSPSQGMLFRFCIRNL